jgi:hypothetical protein
MKKLTECEKEHMLPAGKIADGGNPDTANDFYYRYKVCLFSDRIVMHKLKAVHYMLLGVLD